MRRMDMKTRAVIPARYESSRFPGKPIVPILGKPMIYWPYTAADGCPDIDAVIVATDDKRVERVCDGQYSWIRSREKHTCGTERVAETFMRWGPEPDIAINLQCDEVLATPHILSMLIHAFDDKRVDIATLCHGMSTQQARSPAITKVVVDRSMNAMYFSRSIIPHTPRDGYCLGHIGIYGFRAGILRAVAQMDSSALERAEGLEQLRWMDAGLKIRVVHVPDEHDWVSINTPEDVPLAEYAIRRRVIS
jgi:3-deoxy-manno-octulosonate cytidylyltransferase (CMP-KDO synthetase)